MRKAHQVTEGSVRQLLVAATLSKVRVVTVDAMATESVGSKASRPSRLIALKDGVWRVITATVGACLRHRVTGLAAEAAFFAILSLPPLVFGLAASISYVILRVDPTLIENFQAAVVDISGKVMTPEGVTKIV